MRKTYSVYAKDIIVKTNNILTSSIWYNFQYFNITTNKILKIINRLEKYMFSSEI